MKKSILLKKFLTIIMASFSIIFVFISQNCSASVKNNLKFCSDLDKSIFIKVYNDMISKNKELGSYKDSSSEFVLSDYYSLKDYILLMSGNNYDYKEKEEIILSFIKTFRNSLGDYNKFFFPKKRFEKNPELSLFFESDEEKKLFLNFYNIMCFCEDKEYLFIAEENVVTKEELNELKIFFCNTNNFFQKKYADEILDLLKKIECYNDFFLKKLNCVDKMMK